MFHHSEGDSIRFSVVPSTALASLAPPHSLHVAAGVAVHSTLVAITAQACARMGVLGRRGFALETAAARVCREAGGRVMTNTLVRDMDLAQGANNKTDGLRLEVVVDGLSLFQGAQLAIDTTVVSALRARRNTEAPSHESRRCPGRCACTEGGHVSGASRRGQSCQTCRPRGRSGRTLVCRGGTVHPRGGGVERNISPRVHASVRRACMVPLVAKDVGVHRGESFRQLLAGTPFSCLSCRSYPVGARRDSGRPSHEMGGPAGIGASGMLTD